MTVSPPSTPRVNHKTIISHESDSVLQAYITKVNKQIADYKEHGKALPISPPQPVDASPKPTRSDSRYMDAEDSSTFKEKLPPQAEATKSVIDAIKVKNYRMPVAPIDHQTQHKLIAAVKRRRSVMRNGFATGPHADQKHHQDSTEGKRPESPSAFVAKPFEAVLRGTPEGKGE